MACLRAAASKASLSSAPSRRSRRPASTGLQAFEEAGFHWQNVAGTSAGAVASALVAAGYSAAEMREIMETRVEFRKMVDEGTLGGVPFVGQWLNLLFHEGFYHGG